MRDITNMIAGPNIAAKIIFSSNNAQFKNIGTHFMLQCSNRECNCQVIQNGIAIDPNLYIALINQGDMQRPASVEQYKA